MDSKLFLNGMSMFACLMASLFFLSACLWTDNRALYNRARTELEIKENTDKTLNMGLKGLNYTLAGDNAKAEQIYLNAIKEAKQSQDVKKNSIHLLLASSNLIDLLARQKKYEEAINVAEDLYDFNEEKIQNDSLKRIALKKLSEIYSMKKERSKAISYFKEYLKLLKADSTVRKEVIREVELELECMMSSH